MYCSEFSDCTSCLWSWPVGGDWSDPKAACRCAKTESDEDADPRPTPSGQFPGLQVEIDGQKKELFIVHPSWSNAATSSSTLIYDYNNRMYLSTVDAVDP